MTCYTAIYLMHDDLLEGELRNAMQRVAELREEQAKRAKWTPEFRLSCKLHQVMCGGNKDCDFNYQFGPNGGGANLAEPKQYLDMAYELTRNFTPEQVEKLIKIIGR